MVVILLEVYVVHHGLKLKPNAVYTVMAPIINVQVP